MLEVRLPLEASSEGLQDWNDVLDESTISKRMHVLYIHDSLVDLLACYHVCCLKLRLLE